MGIIIYAVIAGLIAGLLFRYMWKVSERSKFINKLKIKQRQPREAALTKVEKEAPYKKASRIQISKRDAASFAHLGFDCARQYMRWLQKPCLIGGIRE